MLGYVVGKIGLGKKSKIVAAFFSAFFADFWVAIKSGYIPFDGLLQTLGKAAQFVLKLFVGDLGLLYQYLNSNCQIWG